MVSAAPQSGSAACAVSMLLPGQSGLGQKSCAITVAGEPVCRCSESAFGNASTSPLASSVPQNSQCVGHFGSGTSGCCDTSGCSVMARAVPATQTFMTSGTRPREGRCRAWGTAASSTALDVRPSRDRSLLVRRQPRASDASWATNTTAPRTRRNGVVPRTSSSSAHTSSDPCRTPSTAVACAADRSSIPSRRVASHTHRAGFGGCHRVSRPSDERNHQEKEVRRASLGSVVVEEVTPRTYPCVLAPTPWPRAGVSGCLDTGDTVRES